MAYDYINQPVISSCLIEPKATDSFYNPVTLGHTGFAFDGRLYSAGVPHGVSFASWYLEPTSDSRGVLQTFPTTGIVILSNASLTILDGSSSLLNMWMLFVLADGYALTNNFNGAFNGWTPTSLTYANGRLTVVYTPDLGNQTGVNGATHNVDSVMAVTLDFSKDLVYLDVAI